MVPSRLFPPPLSIEEQSACFVVRNDSGVQLVGRKISRSLNAANPDPVPTPSRRHPLPATADAYADSGGEDWEMVPEVMEVSEVAEVMKMSEVMSRHPAMVEGMYASPSAGHAKVVCAAEATGATKAVHAAAEAMASKTTHRVGGQWRGKHRQNDSTSDCYFAEHDNSPDCQIAPRYTENGMQNLQMSNDLISDTPVI
jgi:hypothetical protein